MSHGNIGAGTRNRAAVGTIAGCAVLAGVLALTLAPLGSTALYLVAGLIVLGIAVHALRADLRPLLDARLAARRANRRRASWRTGPIGRSGVVVIVVAAVVLAVLLAGLPPKTLMALVGVGAAGAVGWAFWPLLRNLVTAAPTDLPVRTGAPRAATPGAGPRARAVGLTLTAVAAAVAAVVAAPLGIQGLLALAGGVGVVALLVLVRDKTVFFTFAAVCSLTFVLHKSFTTEDLDQSGGAISVYVTTFDLVVLVLYGIWIAEGSMLTQARAAIRLPIIWLPLAGALLMLPSLLVAPSLLHAAAELFRMMWMYLLYFYIAVRVRSRRHVRAILGGLGVFAVVELVVVVLQTTTGGVLGLSFLGVPTELGARTTDSTEIGRPFGTIIHPVFMGAVLGSLALLALGLAIELKRSPQKLAALAFVPICLIPLYLAQTRASLVAALVAGAAMVAAGLVRKRLQWATIGKLFLAAVVAVAVFLPQLITLYDQNFGTSHYDEEVASRGELNTIAGHMIADHPILGVGFNNFELVLPSYEPSRVIFFGNPVHNLYLLTLAETGIVGFAGLVLVGVAMFGVAARLGRSQDRLFGGIGLGVAGAMGFLSLEELLGFSLRQDIPLAMYWLMAGLAVACRRMAGPDHRRGLVGRGWKPLGTRQSAPQSAPRATRIPVQMTSISLGARVFRRRPTRMGLFTGGLTVALLSGGVLIAPAATAAAPAAGSDRVTFTAIERATGIQGIFVADGDGGGIRRITPADGRFYTWPRWAYGGSKIVFTARRGDVNSPEDIDLMNADGTGVQVVQHFEYRVSQPIIDPTGRWLTYTAQVPWFPLVALFRMDLRTLESTNLSAITSPTVGFDSDPTLSADSRYLVVANSDGKRTGIDLMKADGTTRQRLTHDDYFNADPGISGDGTRVVMSSYRGKGNPSNNSGDPTKFLGVHPDHWNIVVLDTDTGLQKVLTTGANCTVRPLSNPCAVTEMSGFVPRLTPDGTAVGFTGALDDAETWICVVDLDGTGGRALIRSSALAIDWFDWTVPTGTTPSTAYIGSSARASRVLMTLIPRTGPNQIVIASADLMHRITIPLPAGLDPVQARWSPDRASIVFTAKVAIPTSRASPHPAAPAGRERRDHATLDVLDPGDGTLPADRSQNIPADFAQQQVFLRAADGRIRQLTDPWIEDWQDGVPPGDERASTNPVLSADGRFVYVTNYSTLTGESFILKIDLRSGAVLNLTNATSGAIPVNDADAALSPDGTRIAFAWTELNGLRNIYVMDAADGMHVTQVTDSTDELSEPAWLPDGSGLVFSDAGATGHAVGLAQYPVDPSSLSVFTASQTLTPNFGFPGQPAVTPEGDRVLFIGPSNHGLGIYAAGTRPGSGTRQLQPDLLDNVLFVDSR